MLKLYRRHVQHCPGRAKGRMFVKCQCPVWCDGTLDGRDFRKSVGTRDWNEANHRIRAWESKGLGQKGDEPEITLKDLMAKFTADMTERNLAPATRKKYLEDLASLNAFGDMNGKQKLKDWDVKLASDFRSTWKNEGQGAVKRLERTRTIFKFALDLEWIPANPFTRLKPPKVASAPTLPFTEREMVAILDACDRYGGKRRQLRALVLLMRYTGLRIGDALTLRMESVQGDVVMLRTAKTGVPVRCPVPPVVLEALASFEPESKHCYFWTGVGQPDALGRLWMKKLQKVFVDAGVNDGHSHRFRDTFAVELFKQGTPIERVSALLAHSNIRVTQRHYNPWVRERQAQLEEDVRRTWDQDPILRSKEPGKVVSIRR